MKSKSFCYQCRSTDTVIFDRKLVYFIICFLQFFFIPYGFASDFWITDIRKDHPRLFFNKETWPSVRARALGVEMEWYAELLNRVDGYPDNPTIEYARSALLYDRKEDGTYITLGYDRGAEVGVQAAHTAFVYLATKDPRYLEKTNKMLAVAIDLYHECYEKRMTVNWYSTSRVHWLAAYTGNPHTFLL